MRKVTWLVNPWGSLDDLKPYGWLRLSLPFGNFEVLYLDEEVPFLLSKKGPQSPIPWYLMLFDSRKQASLLKSLAGSSFLNQHVPSFFPTWEAPSARGWMDGRTESPAFFGMASGHGTGSLFIENFKFWKCMERWTDMNDGLLNYFFHIFYHFLGLNIFPTNFEITRRAWCQALSCQIRIIRTVRLLRFLRGQGIMLVYNGIRRWPQLTTVTVSVGTLTWTCLLTPKTTGLKLHVFPRNNSGSILRFDWSSSADLVFFTNLRIPHPMSNQNRFLGGTRILSQLSPTSWMITGDPLCTASWSTHC